MNIRWRLWGWECNARWAGKGNQFNITVPTRDDVVIEGVKYVPAFKHIEVWGYMRPDKNMDTQYKNDFLNPEKPSCDSGRTGDGGADGTPQSHQPKGSLK